MALDKTVPYTPFNETSFGYGSDEIRAAYGETEYGGDGTFPNATDIVKVTISWLSGNWDNTTGHLSTPSVGTAVAVYNKSKKEWYVKGQRDDVDAVLAAMSFFPADKSQTRNWNPEPLRDNLTAGNYSAAYSDEEPPTIGDTYFTVRVFDGATQVSSQDIVFDATEVVFGNQRPYFSVVPTAEDLNTTEHDASTGGLVDLGTISHGTDTENVKVSCAFRNYGITSNYTGTALGSFTDESSIYIGDKKPATTDNDNARFDFTGSITEAQTFLDNIRYTNHGNQTTFDMFLTITDGVVGSTLTKTCYFSDATFATSHAMPDLEGTEETTITGLNQDPSWTINYPAEVNQFYYVITLDSTGTDGVSDMFSTLGAGTFSNGVYTSINCVSPSALVLRMNTTNFELRDDFNDNFTYTIQFFGFNSTIGSSYSSAIETVNVTMTGTNEISNLITSHSFSEDSRYTFSSGAGLPNIAHGYNVQYTARITASDANAVDVIWTGASGYTHGTDFFWENGDQLRMVGTRDQVNEMLNSVYFDTQTDYDQNFSFSYHQTRLGGDTTPANAANGDYYNLEIGSNNCISMTAIPHDEFSISQVTNIAWQEDVSKIFDSGLRITDESDEHQYTSTYQTGYRVELALWDGATEFTDGTLVANTTTGLTQSGNGLQNGQGNTNLISYAGSKTDVNAALADLKFIPNADYVGIGTEVYYKIVRISDSVVLTDQAQNTKTTFATGTGHDDYSSTQTTVDWTEDTLVSFDSGLQITDLADENPDLPQYQSNYEVIAKCEYWDGSAWQPFVLADNTTPVVTFTTSNTEVTTSGNGTVASPLVITGTKTQVNNALENLTMIPHPDETGLTGVGQFSLRYSITRTYDSSNTGFPNFNIFTPFSSGTAQAQYSMPTPVDKDWIVNREFNFDSDIEILDTADEVVGGVAFGSDYKVEARAKFNDSTDFDGGVFNCTTLGSATKSGNGTVASPLVITGSKSDINTALDNMQFLPDVDFGIGTIQGFRLEWKISRVTSPATFLNYANSNTFSDSPTIEDFTIIRNTVSYTEETPQDFNTGLVISETITENQTYYPSFFDTEYKIEMRSSDSNNNITNVGGFKQSATMSLLPLNNITGNGTNHFSFEGKKADVNSALSNVTFNPLPDQTDPVYVGYKITRLQNSRVIADFAVSSTVDFSTGTDTAEYYAGYINTQFDIGSLTGNIHTLLNGLDVGITDNAEDVTSNVTYEVTLEIGDRAGVAPYTINPSVNDFVQFNANPYVERDYFDIIDYVENNTVVITGTKSQVNSAIQNLEFYVDLDYPHDNSNSGYDPELMYTQKRFINGILDATHVERDLKTRFDW